MKKVGILKNRFDLIGLKLANKVPIEPLIGFGSNLLGLGAGFLVPIFTKISSTQCQKIVNQLVRVVFGHHNERDLF
jgi:uncharacterized membrane protein